MGPSTRRKLVAIDPGGTTGVAVFDCFGNLEISLPCRETQSLEALLVSYPNAIVVAERGPSFNRRQGEVVAPVEEIIKRWSKTLHWVRPTEWKPSPAAKLLPSDKPTTKHEKDAIRMGRWFIYNRPEYFVSAA